MNLIGGYPHHPHHPHLNHRRHLRHEPFPFVQRCPQDGPFFQSWVLNHGEVAPDFHVQAAAAAAAAASPYPGVELHGGAGAPHEPRLGDLQAAGCGALVTGKRRGAGPKKERRRTESINSAFAELRECIPNVPADTKLSKIKTLRLATSYISYLMDVLAKDTGETEGFKAEIKKLEGRDLRRRREPSEGLQDSEKKVKGRTGWPQQVWALELNQ